jgi:rhodanese-related sulfurtransferase
VAWSYTGCAQNKLDIAVNAMLDFSVDTISTQGLEKLITTNQDIYLLDAREPEEFDVSRIPGAKYVGFESFDPKSVKDIPKDATVITYCSIGYRSEIIGEKLEKLGYKDVRNLHGGIFAWKNSGRSVVDSQESFTDSVHTYNKAWSFFLIEGVKVYE